MTGMSIPGLGGVAEQAGIEAADATRRAVEDFLGLRKPPPPTKDAPRCPGCGRCRLTRVVTAALDGWRCCVCTRRYGADEVPR